MTLKRSCQESWDHKKLFLYVNSVLDKISVSMNLRFSYTVDQEQKNH